MAAFTGTSGADNFVFASGWNDDTITDFNVDEDVLDLRGSGLTYSDLTIEQSDTDTTVTDGDGNVLTLEDVAPFDMLNVNFIGDDFATFFVPDTNNGESAMPTTGARPETVSEGISITSSGTISGGDATFFLHTTASSQSAVLIDGSDLNVSYEDDVWIGGWADADYIEGTYYGFGISSAGNELTVAGEMVVVAGYRTGIGIITDGGNTINHQGDMTVIAAERAWGVTMAGSQVANTGTMTIWAGDSGRAYGINNSSGIVDIDNGGTITASGGSASFGIRAASRGGTISNSGQITAEVGIYAEIDLGALTITNSGTVTGSAYAIQGSGDVGITVNNTGTLDGAVSFGAGDDVLTGGGLVTGTIDGGAGDDALAGGSGDDTLAGGAGADTMEGGAGQDLLDYTASSAGVMADLSRGRARAGDAEGDRFSGMEDVAGTAFNDTLIGDAGDNRLMGGDGFDLLAGDAGADYLHGGGGHDRVNYGASATAVNVDLDAGRGYAGDAAGDVLIRIEEVVGSAFDDTLTGSTGGNKFWAGDGDDLVTAEDGNDVLYGEAGNDTLDGGDGRDILLGGSGDDSLTGNLGNDIIETGAGADTLLYADGHGGDFITDFNADEDTLDLTALTGIDSFADLSAENASMRGQSGVLLHTSGIDFIFVAGVSISEIEGATTIS
ncbi:calcium-binding protein [Kordiimonas aestuarii]|uniref:calcium-binding protein n=1 Tax=Kordiimonas aestuarii TaxID=1005925 RepID=UPI0021CE7CC8|nr:calcium-binding protein [Kordiimonas aestuarii]